MDITELLSNISVNLFMLSEDITNLYRNVESLEKRISELEKKYSSESDIDTLSVEEPL